MQVKTSDIRVFVDAVYRHLSTLSNRNTFGSFSYDASFCEGEYYTTLTRQPTVDDWDNIEAEIVAITNGDADGILRYYDGAASAHLMMFHQDFTEVFQALANKANELSMPEDA